ncbi:hypothetical protein CTI14_39960, partial [Methylobacterium radiotolerans]
AQENLARAKALARGHMQDSKVRFLLLRLQESAGLNEGMAEQWKTLQERSENPAQYDSYIERCLAWIEKINRRKAA